MTIPHSKSTETYTLYSECHHNHNNYSGIATYQSRSLRVIDNNCVICKCTSLNDQNPKTYVPKSTIILRGAMCVSGGLGVLSAISAAIAALPTLCVFMANYRTPFSIFPAVQLPISGGLLLNSLALVGILIAATVFFAILYYGLAQVKNYCEKTRYIPSINLEILTNTMFKIIEELAKRNEGFKKLLTDASMTDQGIKNILKDKDLQKLIPQVNQSYKKFAYYKSKSEEQDIATNNATLSPEQLQKYKEKFDADISNISNLLISKICENIITTDENKGKIESFLVNPSSINLENFKGSLIAAIEL